MTNVSIKLCEKPYNEFFDAYVIRGIGKRAIRVIMAGMCSPRYEFDDNLFILAAKVAANNGWKNVVVKPDYMSDEYAVAFNIDLMNSDWDRGYNGIFLCQVVDSCNY